MIRIDIITAFPEMFRGFLSESIVARAARAGIAAVRTVDIRDFARDRRRTIDDKPYSGGPGMLLKPEPWFEAVETCLAQASATGVETRVITTSPAGARYDQRMAEAFSRCGHLVFLCGHYEGFDERIRRLATDEISIGDFVLTGGELPAAAMVDSIVRLLPGAIGGGAAAVANESFGDGGLLESPQYTRPPSFRGMDVPHELTNGNHALAENWRRRQAFDLTSRRRPDLLSTGGTFAAGCAAAPAECDEIRDARGGLADLRH